MSGDIPRARDGHSACVISNFMYVFGGYEEETDQFSQDVHKLDLNSMEWSFVKTKVILSSNLFMSYVEIELFFVTGRTTELSRLPLGNRYRELHVHFRRAGQSLRATSYSSKRRLIIYIFPY